MKINRTKYAVKNIYAGAVLKIFQMLVPFMMRTIMIYYMGVQYLGLTSLFTSILQVLNLAELGVGTAMVFSMYKPIAEDDIQTICALMRLYRRYYRIIGLIIAVVGLIITPFIPVLISGEIPNELNIYVLYLMNLGATVLTYWLFAYKNCLLTAYQRTSVISLITLFTNVLQYGLQIFIVIILKNYYLYVAAILVTQVLNNLLTAAIVTKQYPNYRPVGKLEDGVVKDIKNRIKDLFIAKIGGAVLGSADTIVISAFLGLTILAVYQNYFYIISSIYGFVEIILTSITAGIGNSMITESNEKNYNDMRKFTFMFMWLIGFCICCFLGIFQPFMVLWVGENLLLPFSVIICFCFYFLSYEITRLLNTFKSAAGVWHEDRFRPLISAIVNLSFNLVSVKYIGVYGIILSTVFALSVVEVPWLLHNIFTIMYDHSLMKTYIKDLIVYLFGIIFASVITVLLTQNYKPGSILSLVVCAGISFVVPNVVFFAVYRRNELFSPSMIFVKKFAFGHFKSKV